MTTDNKDVTSCKELQEFVTELHQAYEVWYAKSVRNLAIGYYLLQSVSILSGFVVSLLAISGTGGRLALAIVAALGSISAGVLLQFRIYDRCT